MANKLIVDGAFILKPSRKILTFNNFWGIIKTTTIKKDDILTDGNIDYKVIGFELPATNSDNFSIEIESDGFDKNELVGKELVLKNPRRALFSVKRVKGVAREA